MMNDFFNRTPPVGTVGIVFIPDYVATALANAKLPLERLSKSVHYDSVDDDLVNNLLKAISKSDIIDWIEYNDICYKTFFGMVAYDEGYPMLMNRIRSVYKYHDVVTSNARVIELLNLYNNNKLDYNSILLSGEMKNNLYSTIITEHNMFVIIHDGFTTPVVKNDKEFSRQFSISLMDCMFKSFDERLIYGSYIFRKFMCLK